MIRMLSTTTIVRVLGACMQLVMSLVIARLLGATSAGVFFYHYAIIVILSSISKLGSDISGMRKVAAYKSQGNTGAVKTAIIARIFVTLFMSCLFAFAFYLTLRSSTDARDYLLASLASSIPVSAIVILMSELIKSLDRATLAVFLQNVCVPMLTFCLALLANLLTELSASNVALCFLAANIITLIIMAVTWPKTRDGTGKNARRMHTRTVMFKEIKTIIQEAPTLLLISSTSIVMQWIGAIILGIFSYPTQVAGYSVAIRLSIAVSIIHSAASSVIAPKMAVLQSQRDIDELKKVSHQSSILISATTLPLLLLIFAFAPFWLSCFGAEFVQFSTVLRLLMIGQVIAAVIGHSGTVLTMSERYREARWSTIIAAVSLLVLMPPLSYFGGASGAAVAMSCGVAMGHITAALLNHRVQGFCTAPLSAGDFKLAILKVK